MQNFEVSVTSWPFQLTGDAQSRVCIFSLFILKYVLYRTYRDTLMNNSSPLHNSYSIELLIVRFFVTFSVLIPETMMEVLSNSC